MMHARNHRVSGGKGLGNKHAASSSIGANNR
jgi:hypothetical protein